MKLFAQTCVPAATMWTSCFVHDFDFRPLGGTLLGFVFRQEMARGRACDFMWRGTTRLKLKTCVSNFPYLTYTNCDVLIYVHLLTTYTIPKPAGLQSAIAALVNRTKDEATATTPAMHTPKSGLAKLCYESIACNF